MRLDFEIHLTVHTTNVEQFKQDCQSIGVKPILIETENQNSFGYQAMTSCKYSSNLGYRHILDYAVHELQLMGYTVIRQKVEKQPEKTKDPEHIYYESHLRLKIPYFFDYNPYKAFFVKEGWHLSKNIFKKDDDHQYHMVTFRTNDMTLEDFKNKVKIMENWLDNFKLKYDKVEIEECIFDSNESIDLSWLKKQK